MAPLESIGLVLASMLHSASTTLLKGPGPHLRRAFFDRRGRERGKVDVPAHRVRKHPKEETARSRGYSIRETLD